MSETPLIEVRNLKQYFNISDIYKFLVLTFSKKNKSIKELRNITTISIQSIYFKE